MTEPRDAVRFPTTGLGIITPSANVVVERVTAAVLRDFPAVSGHFSRIAVIGAADSHADDYDWDGMLAAATLLSHAAPACICWNGSKGGTIGFDTDRDLCARITQRTGLPATTSTLAIDTALRLTGAKRIAMVTPYTTGFAVKIPPVFRRAGYDIVGQAHAGLNDNLAYASLPDTEILAMSRAAAAGAVDALIIYCTNLASAHLVAGLEQELGVPVYDSVSAGLWGALRLAGQKTTPGLRWGSLFGLPPEDEKRAGA